MISYVPKDGFAGTLIGRVWIPERITGTIAGPSPVLVTEEGVFDLSPLAPTCGDLLNANFNRSAVDLVPLERLGDYEAIMANTMLTGTLFAPTQDRGAEGEGFTHKVGDIVTIRSDKLGVLQNRVVYCDQAPPWEFGISALMRNLSTRGIL